MKQNPRPFSALRTQALACFEAGIAAADPYAAVQRCIRVVDNHIELALDVNDERQTRVGRWTKIHLIAFGKAACAMTQAVQAIVPSSFFADTAVIVTPYENCVDVSPFTATGAGHPLPDAAGWQAAQQVIAQLKQAQQGELVLVLISGGGSALLPAPVEPITLAEKIATTQLLLTSGANINEINVIRKHLSQLKGGQLARLAAPADCHALILSDVLGDDLSSIASGPTVADDSTYAQAMDILTRYGLWDNVPDSVQQVFIAGQSGLRSETPKAGEAIFKHTSQILIGSNAMSLTAAAQTAQQLGYRPQIYSHALTGIAREQAEQWVLHIKNLINQGISEKTAWLAGGETTVQVTGSGRGGRNQEFALAFAVAAKKHRLPACWAFLSGGTDGKDGLTDAAGGLVDPDSLERMRTARVNAANRLNNNDSYTALHSSNDLVITGATGTNVADLQVLLLNPAVLI